jgi:hypothetical protein
MQTPKVSRVYYGTDTRAAELQWLGPEVTAIAERTRLSRDGSPRENAGTSLSFAPVSVKGARDASTTVR